MRRFPVLVFSMGTVVTCCVLGVTSAVASPHAVAATGGGTWGTAKEVPSSATLNAGNNAQVNSVSCGSAGNCAGGGYYKDSSGHQQAFVVNEANGTWGTAEEVPGTGALNADGTAQVNSVSCGSAGNCAAGGYYTDSAGHQQAWVANETNGTWANAQEVPGAATLNAGGLAQVLSVSCVSAGNCTAGGFYDDSTSFIQAFVASESNGTWGTAQEVPGTGGLNAEGGAKAFSVSCASAGNCAAGGDYTDSSSHPQAWVADETSGTWANAQEVPGTATLNSGGAQVTSVSCASAGDCALGGDYHDSSNHEQAFVADETAGTWANAQEVPGTATLNTGGSAAVLSVSCASAGNCAAGGDYSASGTQAFLADETNGTWGTGFQVAGSLNTTGDAQVNSVSCPSAGNCAAGGFYQDSSFSGQAFVVDETGGTWGTPQEVPGTGPLNTGGDAQVTSVSCASAGNCAAGGSYLLTTPSGAFEAFVDNETELTPTSTLLSATVGDGLRLTATVTASGSTASPAGTVTFTDNSTILGTATLKASGAGKATASVTDFSLPAGANDFKATFSPSNSATVAASSGTLDMTLPIAITWVRPGSPAISGTAVVGDTLTAKPGTWGPSGVRLAYQWRANGSAISGATGATLGLGTAEFGKKITVTVTGFADGDITVSATSPATGTVGKGTLRSSVPKITGTARVGDTLKVALGTWTPGTGFKYQWLANGKAIPKATGSSLKLTRAQQGKKISVRVTGSKTDYNPATKTSGQTGAVGK